RSGRPGTAAWRPAPPGAGAWWRRCRDRQSSRGSLLQGYATVQDVLAAEVAESVVDALGRHQHELGDGRQLAHEGLEQGCRLVAGVVGHVDDQFVDPRHRAEL